MRKASVTTSAHGPLAGVRILVGRARHQAGVLSAELQKMGATVIEIPFIEIRKPRSFKDLDEALRHLSNYDWLILTSANGVEAMQDRIKHLKLPGLATNRKKYDSGRPTKRIGKETALAAGPRVAAIGPATKKALEQHGIYVDVVPKEYVAESVVRSLTTKVKGKRVLLVRAKVARDVIPGELRKAGAAVDVVGAYETVVPKSSRNRLQKAWKNPQRRPHLVTFTSSSTVRNFVELAGVSRGNPARLKGIRMASIGPVTSATLREHHLPVDIAAKEFTIPGLVAAIAKAFASPA